MIEKAMTPDWEKVVRDSWPEWNEESYAQISHGEVDAAGRTVQGTSGVQQMRATTDETMTGETQEAADETFSLRSTNLGQRGEFHGNRAVTAGLLATNTANTKAQINALAAQHEANVERLKVQAVANGMTQRETQDEYDKIVQASQEAVDKLKGQHDDTHAALRDQFVEGAEPEVPPSMPGSPPGGEGGSTALDLPSNVQSKVSNLMGTGGDGGMGMQQLLGQGAGMAQGALGQLGQLGQLGSHTPGSDVINPALQSLTQMLGGASGGDQAQVTPEMLDQLLSGQDTGGADAVSGDGDKSDVDAQAASDPKPDDSPADKVEEHKEPEHKVDEKPSPAGQPVSAAPPASATVPGTQLSGDMGGGVAPAPAAGGDTHLSGAGATPNGTSALAASAPAQSAPGPNAGPIGAGAGMGSGLGMGLGPVGNSTSASRTAASRPGQAASAGSGMVPLEDILGGEVTAAAVPSTASTAPWILSVVSAVSGAYHRAGFNGPVAVALLGDNTAVFCTADGLGVIPRGVRLPENVIPLSEFPSLNELFRADWTGGFRPGDVLRLAADLDLIPSVTTILTTAVGDTGTTVTPDILRGVC